MEPTEQRAEPSIRLIQKCESRCIEEREELSIHEVDEKANDSCLVWIFDEDGSEHHRDVHPGEACELRGDQDRGYSASTVFRVTATCPLFRGNFVLVSGR